MLAGDRLISVAKGMEFVWHVKYVAEDTSPRLPVVADDVLYQLNRKARGVQGACLVASKQVEGAKPNNKVQQQLWSAWPGTPMNVLIEAGGVIFSAGAEKIYATKTTDGEELWSAPVPSEVTDLAFHE